MADLASRTTLTSRVTLTSRMTLTFVVLACLTAVCNGQVTCTMPGAVKGSVARLTCLFDEDLQNQTVKRTLTIDRMPVGRTKENIMTCKWDEKDDSYYCKVFQQQFLFSNKITDRLTLQFPDVGERAEGEYLCRVERSPNPRSCNFSLIEEQFQGSGGSGQEDDSAQEESCQSCAPVIFFMVLFAVLLLVVMSLVLLHFKRPQVLERWPCYQRSLSRGEKSPRECHDPEGKPACLEESEAFNMQPTALVTSRNESDCVVVPVVIRDLGDL